MLHAPSRRRERIGVYGDRGGGKSSVVVSLADWYLRTRSDRRIWYADTRGAWVAVADGASDLDAIVNHIPLARDACPGKSGWVRQIPKGDIHPDDWFCVDMQDDAWETAQSYYWGQKSGNDSLAELWLKMKPEQVAGDHGTNWGVIKKFYFEWNNAVLDLPCHVLFLVSAEDVREPGRSGKGGDDAEVRSTYEKAGHKMRADQYIRGDVHTVIYAFEANGKWRYTTIKEMGPIGRPKREYLVNKDVTDKGFVPGYLIPVAGWRP